MNTDSMQDRNDDTVTMDRVAGRLKVGEEYTYAQMCEAFGEGKTSGGWQRKYQKQRWARFVEWKNPSKRMYAIVDVFESPVPKPEDGRKNNGGKRDNAGARVKCEEENAVLLGSFCALWESRSMYNGAEMDEIYFSNADIGKYFGILTDDMMAIEEQVDSLITSTIAHNPGFRIIDEKALMLRNAGTEVKEKLLEKVRTVLNRMEKIEGAVLEYGIIAYKDTSQRGLRELHDEYEKMGWSWPQDKRELERPDRRNDLLERWNKLSEVYQRKHNLRNLGEVANSGLWNDMVEWISESFPGYRKVTRTRKLRSVNGVLLSELAGGEYPLGAIEECRRRYNAVIADEVVEFFMRRKDEPAPYTFIVDKYLRLSPHGESDKAYENELKESPEVEGALLRILGCSRIALRSHIDWIGLPPREMLEKILSLRPLSLRKDGYSSKNGSGYWSDLKKAINGDKTQGRFGQRAA